MDGFANTTAFVMNETQDGMELNLPENPITHNEYHETNVAVEVFAVILVVVLLLCTYGIPAVYSLVKRVKECCDDDDCEVNTKVSCHCCEDSTCYQVK